MAIQAVKHSRGGGKGARYGLNRAESGPWVRDGDKNDSRAGRKRGRRPAGRVRDRGRRGAAGTTPHAFAYRR